MIRHTFVILALNESDDLEECIKSVVNQSVKSNVVVATSTPNDYIMELASKYALGVMVNESESNKGNDYNFAINSFRSRLVTIAHQDDLYDRNYTREILKAFKKHPDAAIIFTDNYEIDNDKKIKCSKSLRIRKWFLFPLAFKMFMRNNYMKMRALRPNKYLCTSSVTFVKKNIKRNVFPTNLIYYNDWQGLIDLAKTNAKFVFVNQKLVGYRLSVKKENNMMREEKENIQRSLYSPWVYEHFINKKKRDKNV